MRNFIRTATTQKWLSLMCIPIIMLTIGAWSCSAKQQQTITQYVGLALDTGTALAGAIPQLAPIVPFLQAASAGLDAWVPGSPIPANVVAALQAALPKAEADFPGITASQKDLISILIVAVQGALTIAGVATVATVTRLQASNPYAGMTPAQLRKAFNKQAPVAGVKTI